MALKIRQGEDKDVVITLIDEDTELPIDVSLATEITVRFMKTDGTVLAKLLSLAAVTIISGPGGKIKAALSDTETAALKVTASGDVIVWVDFGALRKIARSEGQLIVEKMPF